MKIAIADRIIGPGEPVFFIAEAGVNHNTRLDLALALVDAAADAAADAVKFQTFRPEDLAIESAPMAEYQERNIGVAESQRSMLKKLELPEEFYGPILDRCRERRIMFISTPHGGIPAVDFLASLGVPALKLGSGDLTNLPLLRHAARLGKPLIVSTGMATREEVGEAVGAIRETGNDQIIVLHCTTNYPCPAEEVNLRAMQTMAAELGVLVGYSDHTLGAQVPIMAATLGAVALEKHFTLDRHLEGPDHKASAEPEELKKIIAAIRRVPVILGSFEKRPNPSEFRVMAAARKSIVTAAPIKRGEVFTPRNLGIKRPGNGIHPREYEGLLGRTATADIPADVLLEEGHYA